MKAPLNNLHRFSLFSIILGDVGRTFTFTRIRTCSWLSGPTTSVIQHWPLLSNNIGTFKPALLEDTIAIVAVKFFIGILYWNLI
jgi:hypothetical protein